MAAVPIVSEVSPAAGVQAQLRLGSQPYTWSTNAEGEAIYGRGTRDCHPIAPHMPSAECVAGSEKVWVPHDAGCSCSLVHPPHLRTPGLPHPHHQVMRCLPRPHKQLPIAPPLCLSPPPVLRLLRARVCAPPLRIICWHTPACAGAGGGRPLPPAGAAPLSVLQPLLESCHDGHGPRARGCNSPSPVERRAGTPFPLQ